MRLRPWMTASVAIVGLVFGALYIVATGYLFLRDDLLTASIARQTRIQHAYEDRIATLRADIDRLTSRHLLNQQALEAEIERLTHRQAALDSRQDVIAGLSQAARQAGVAPTGEPVETARPGAVDQRADASGALRPRGQGAASQEAWISDRMAQVDTIDRSADELARRQAAYVDAIAASVMQRGQKIAAALERVGVDTGDLGSAGMGGPFVAIGDGELGKVDFRAGVATVQDEILRFTRIRALARSVPLARPIPNASVSSKFGRRMDPFLKRPAMHSGVDFRAKSGVPVKATGAGVVVLAKRAGGYGKLVEIDHGNGLKTRMAHLSRILVKKGQRVERGDVVGKVGSTGRSTGPHLHFEVRNGKKPVDPSAFFAAGADIGDLL